MSHLHRTPGMLAGMACLGLGLQLRPGSREKGQLDLNTGPATAYDAAHSDGVAWGRADPLGTVSDTLHGAQPAVVVFSKTKWAALPESVRAAVSGAGAAISRENFARAEERNEAHLLVLWRRQRGVYQPGHAARRELCRALHDPVEAAFLGDHPALAPALEGVGE